MHLTQGRLLLVSGRQAVVTMCLTHFRDFQLSVTRASPLTAPCKCVQATQRFAQPKHPVLISLHHPYKPLSSNTIGSLTRKGLQPLGVDTQAWGAHSTYGAFVDFYEHLDLTSEVVAEIGQWATLEAFGKHYLGLRASQEASAPPLVPCS